MEKRYRTLKVARTKLSTICKVIENLLILVIVSLIPSHILAQTKLEGLRFYVLSLVDFYSTPPPPEGIV